MSSEPELLGQRIAKFEAENFKVKTKNAQVKQEHAELLERIIKLDQVLDERESKKNRKFQTRCIQIAKEILNEEPMIEYRPPFLNRLELDAFSQKYRIVLEVQGAQHQPDRTSWCIRMSKTRRHC